MLPRFIAAVANALVARHYPLLARLPGGSAAPTTKVPVLDFAEWLSAMDLKDIGFWLSSAYAQLVKADERQKRAMFFHSANSRRSNTGRSGESGSELV